MTAYTDASDISAYLGVTLTSPQQTQAGVLADAATAWVDRYTGRSWQIASPVTDEMLQIIGDTAYLIHRPVATITSVKTRSRYAGADETTLDSADYELLDGPAGVLLISGWSSGDALAFVTYTHSMTTAPADVQLAATMIAAGWLSQSLRPNTSGIDSLAVGQNDVSIKFSASRGDVPSEAVSILRQYRQIVVA